MAAKLSDETQVAMPLRNILSIIAGVAIATWAYFGIIEQTNFFDDVLNEVFGSNKVVWIKDLQALQKKRYKHLKLSSKKLLPQLISVYGKII